MRTGLWLLIVILAFVITPFVVAPQATQQVLHQIGNGTFSFSSVKDLGSQYKHGDTYWKQDLGKGGGPISSYKKAGEAPSNPSSPRY